MQSVRAARVFLPLLRSVTDCSRRASPAVQCVALHSETTQQQQQPQPQPRPLPRRNAKKEEKVQEEVNQSASPSARQRQAPSKRSLKKIKKKGRDRQEEGEEEEAPEDADDAPAAARTSVRRRRLCEGEDADNPTGATRSSWGICPGLSRTTSWPRPRLRAEGHQACHRQSPAISTSLRRGGRRRRGRRREAVGTGRGGRPVKIAFARRGPTSGRRAATTPDARVRRRACGLEDTPSPTDGPPKQTRHWKRGARSAR